MHGQSSITFWISFLDPFSGAKASDFSSAVILKTSGKAYAHNEQPQHSLEFTRGTSAKLD